MSGSSPQVDEGSLRDQFGADAVPTGALSPNCARSDGSSAMLQCSVTCPSWIQHHDLRRPAAPGEPAHHPVAVGYDVGHRIGRARRLLPLFRHHLLEAVPSLRRAVVRHVLRDEVVGEREIAVVEDLIHHDREQGLVLLRVLRRRGAGPGRRRAQHERERSDPRPHDAYLLNEGPPARPTKGLYGSWMPAPYGKVARKVLG